MTVYEKFLRGFADYGPATWEIWVSLLMLVGLAVFLVVSSVFMQKAIEVRKRRCSINEFFRVCREKGLLPNEISLLKQYAVAYGMSIASDLVESNVHFDLLAQQIMAESSSENVAELNHTLTNVRKRIGFQPPPRNVALNSTRELSYGLSLYLVLRDSIFLESQVMNVDERMFVVRLLAGQPKMKIVDDEVIWIFFNRTGDSRYAGLCRIMRHTSDEGGQFIVLEHCNELRRDQRRDDFRVEENSEVRVWVLNKAQEDIEDISQIVENYNYETAILDDLSAGGALILFHKNLPVNQPVLIDLDPQSINKLPIVRGAVLRFNRRGRAVRWALSIRFDDLRPSERQKIVRYVFQKERHKLQFASF